LIAEELNVIEVAFTQEGADYIEYEVKPNFKVLGKLLGKNMPVVKKMLGQSDGGELLEQLNNDGVIKLALDGGDEVELTTEHVEVAIRAKEGWAAAQGRGCVVVLSTELTPELLRTGISKDLVRYVQDQRKEMDLDYTDKIEVAVVTDDAEVKKAIEEHLDFITNETLATSLVGEAIAKVKPTEVQVGDATAELFVRRAT